MQDVPGYEKLRAVLEGAYTQAARGKGKERHAKQDEPFHDQVIAEGGRRFGVGALLFQAYKKAEESQRLGTDAAIKELHGAIVYLAAAVILREEARDVEAPKVYLQERALTQGCDIGLSAGNAGGYSPR